MIFKLLLSTAIMLFGGHALAAEIIYEPVVIAGQESKHGVYDPSVEYDNKGIGWLAYSSISMPNIETRLAKTTDKGQSWTYIQTVNSSKTIEKLIYNGQEIEGVWRNEVPSLVFCPGDKGREWKLFWHKYFVQAPFKPKNKVYPFGWIAYKYAPDPAGKWSDEIALFGAKNRPINPYSTQINLSKLHPELEANFAYTEPGAFCKDGVLYLSLEGSTHPKGQGNWKTRKVILLASYNNTKSWKYLGVLTDSHDAKNLDYTILTASSIFEQENKQYMMLTPGGSLSKLSKDPQGIYIFEFEDINEAKLKRDKNNQLIVQNYIKHSESATNGGHGDFHQQNKTGGLIMGQIKKPSIFSVFSKPKPFQIVCTQQQAVPSQ